MTASLDEDGLATHDEDGFGVCVLIGGVVGGFSDATKQTGMGVSRVSTTALRGARSRSAASRR